MDELDHANVSQNNRAKALLAAAMTYGLQAVDPSTVVRLADELYLPYILDGTRGAVHPEHAPVAMEAPEISEERLEELRSEARESHEQRKLARKLDRAGGMTE